MENHIAEKNGNTENTKNAENTRNTGNTAKTGSTANIEAAFAETFRLIFGECNLKMADLEEYLLKYQPKAQTVTSYISGKQVIISGAEYNKHAKFISHDELDRRLPAQKKSEPLNINKLKDIDSIISAVSEQTVYCGNKIFGNSDFIEESDNITDSFFIKKSHIVHSSKYVAYCSYLHDNCEYTFGSSWSGKSKFLIRVMNALDLVRSFECYSSGIGADLFCTFNCLNCYDCMFSFNLKNKRHAIGNLELSREKYQELHKKLVTEAREYIEKHKNFPTIFEIPIKQALPAKQALLANQAPPANQALPANQARLTNQALPINLPTLEQASTKKPYDFVPIETAWRTTARIVLGEEIGGLTANRQYLSQKIRRTETIRTIYGNEVYYGDLFFFPAVPKNRMLTYEEATELSKLCLNENDLQSLENIFDNLGKIAFFRINFEGGNIANNTKTATAYNSINAYEVLDSTGSKNNAFCTMALESSHCFGSYRAVHCDFCIACHNCTNISRCLEMDCCTNCRDSMFCHNCENISDSMFCFNAKNLRYAIGNIEVGREKYLAAKQAVLAQLRTRIKTADKTPVKGIYEIGTL